MDYDGTPSDTATAVYEPTHETFSRSSIPYKERLKMRDVRKSLLYRMTPLHIQHRKTENFLVGVYHIGGWQGRRLDSKWRIKPAYPNNCSGNNYIKLCEMKQGSFDYSHWNDVRDFELWHSELPIVQSSFIDQNAVQAAVTEVKNRASMKSIRDYDALSELGEAKETLHMFGDASKKTKSLLSRFFNRFSSTDLKAASLIPPFKLVRSTQRAFRQIGNAWLTFRYGVMPLVWSYRDIQKLWTRMEITRDGSTIVVNPTLNQNVNFPTSYIRLDVGGSVRVSATVISKFQSVLTSQLAHTGFNPLSTAWELMPYSFVVDWFINIGDWIAMSFSADLASRTASCVAIRTQVKEIYTLHVSVNESFQPDNWGRFYGDDPCWVGEPAKFTTITNQRETVGALRVVTYDDYARDPFDRSDTNHLIIQPSLNWKRWTDSVFLSHQQIKSFRSKFSKKGH